MAIGANGKVLTLSTSGDKTSDRFQGGVTVDQLTLTSGATGGATEVHADGTLIHKSSVPADSTVDIPLSGCVTYRDIVATTLGTNVVLHVKLK